MNLVTSIPYIAILFANLLYLYTAGFSQQTHWFEIFLFNFFIMALAGIFITIHVNILLHKWLVQESDKDSSGKQTKKEIIKKKVRQLLNLKNFLENLFLPGNQQFLLKVYLGMAVFRWVVSLIPGILAGLLLALYFQYKNAIYERFKPQFQKLDKMYERIVHLILAMMPRYKNIKTISNKQYNCSDTNIDQNPYAKIYKKKSE